MRFQATRSNVFGVGSSSQQHDKQLSWYQAEARKPTRILSVLYPSVCIFNSHIPWYVFSRAMDSMQKIAVQSRWMLN